jgi:betaine-aldehyde dehydrogenase
MADKVRGSDRGQDPAPGEPLDRDLMLVGGNWVEALDGRFLGVENPAHPGSPFAHVPRAGEGDVARAVNAAAVAFHSWCKVPPRDRGKAMIGIAEELSVRSEEMAAVLCRETGNAIRPQARPEVTAAAEVFRYFGGVASEVKGEVVPLGEDVLSYTRREPLGVVAGVIPWNSPVLLGALKIAMAITAGNTLVLKAAEDAPLAVLQMARICAKHLPSGVLNVITGYGEEAGAALARHTLVRNISFTGSTEVGRLMLHAAADRVVPVSLELGGKSPAIVFPDSDDERTVEGVIAGMRFTRQGRWRACSTASHNGRASP